MSINVCKAIKQCDSNIPTSLPAIQARGWRRGGGDGRRM